MKASALVIKCYFIILSILIGDRLCVAEFYSGDRYAGYWLETFSIRSASQILITACLAIPKRIASRSKD